MRFGQLYLRIGLSKLILEDKKNVEPVDKAGNTK